MIAAVKIAVKNNDIDPDTEILMKKEITGKDSLTKMNNWELAQVLRHLDGGSAQKRRSFPGRPAEMTKYMTKIEAYLAEHKLSWNYAHGIGKRMFSVQRLEWLNSGQQRKVMLALMNYSRKRGNTYDV